MEDLYAQQPLFAAIVDTAPHGVPHARSEQVALDYASSPHDFKLMLAAGGQRASGIEQLAGQPEG